MTVAIPNTVGKLLAGFRDGLGGLGNSPVDRATADAEGLRDLGRCFPLAVQLTGLCDTAILDVGLQEEEAFAVADALDARGIPFIFASGYDGTIIPDRYSTIRLCEKPFGLERVTGALTATRLASPALDKRSPP